MNLKLQNNRSLSHLRTNRVHHFGLSEVPSHVHVDSYKSSAILTKTYNVTDDTLIGYKNHTEAAENRQKLHKLSVFELGDCRLRSHLQYSLSPYIITTNIDIEDGIKMNGAIHVLQNIELLDGDEHYAELEAQDEPSTSVATHKQ
ncbi:hypothetical protein TNCV_687961 [Trichonephila clavipes]|nr:hypothetical protein TNCV_687961 [Trichonephila clavipes]